MPRRERSRSGIFGFRKDNHVVLPGVTMHEEFKLKKVKAVKSQKFEEAASYRDNEKNLIEKVEDEKQKWEKVVNMQNMFQVQFFTEILQLLQWIKNF